MNLADMLRAELLNYELEIQLAESRVAYWRAVMDRHSGSESKKAKRRMVLAKMSKEVWETYRQDLIDSRQALARGIDAALGSYPQLHRQVFWECLLKERADSEVAAELGFTEEAIRRVREKILRDLHGLYRP